MVQIFMPNNWVIFISSNNGKTGQQLIMFDKLTVNCIIVSGNNIIAGTDGGIFYSTDEGKSWIAKNSG